TTRTQWTVFYQSRGSLLISRASQIVCGWADGASEAVQPTDGEQDHVCNRPNHIVVPRKFRRGRPNREDEARADSNQRRGAACLRHEEREQKQTGESARDHRADRIPERERRAVAARENERDGNADR